MMISAKQLPFNKEAEISVIGAVYLDPEAYFKISNFLHCDDFYIEKHKVIYKAMESLILEDKLDLVTLNAELIKRGELENIGGIEYIVEVANFVPTSESVVEYAKIVKECSKRRSMIKGYGKAIEDLYNPTVSVKNITDYVQDTVLAGKERANNVQVFSEAYYHFLDELDRRSKSKEKYPGIQTGFQTFDMVTGGLEKHKLYVFGGRPGMGKSAFAINIATNIARDKKNVIFFSLEMSAPEIMKRVISYISQIPSGKLKTATLTDEELRKIVVNAERYASDNLMIVDEPYQTIGTVLSTCVRMNNQLRESGQKIDCIIIDHLHLMSSGTKTRDRRHEIGEITRGAKMLAGKLDCPVVLLSQLSRAEKGKKVERPQLTDLRESGDIEQDADVVAFIHREEYYRPTTDNRGMAEVIIAKVRDGRITSFDLKWNGATTTFSKIEYHEDEGEG